MSYLQKNPIRFKDFKIPPNVWQMFYNIRNKALWDEVRFFLLYFFLYKLFYFFLQVHNGKERLEIASKEWKNYDKDKKEEYYQQFKELYGGIVNPKKLQSKKRKIKEEDAKFDDDETISLLDDENIMENKTEYALLEKEKDQAIIELENSKKEIEKEKEIKLLHEAEFALLEKEKKLALLARDQAAKEFERFKKIKEEIALIRQETIKNKEECIKYFLPK